VADRRRGTDLQAADEVRLLHGQCGADDAVAVDANIAAPRVERRPEPQDRPCNLVRGLLVVAGHQPDLNASAFERSDEPATTVRRVFSTRWLEDVWLAWQSQGARGPPGRWRQRTDHQRPQTRACLDSPPAPHRWEPAPHCSHVMGSAGCAHIALVHPPLVAEQNRAAIDDAAEAEAGLGCQRALLVSAVGRNAHRKSVTLDGTGWPPPIRCAC
jgi:hypothetical protein